MVNKLKFILTLGFEVLILLGLVILAFIFFLVLFSC